MNAAVMVDLGWPWWVTSLAAAAVVVLAAWVALRSRNTAVRAVAALLVLQGLAVAIAAPLVMEDQEGNGTGKAMSGEARGVDREEFARRADANCNKFDEFASSLGSPTTPEGIARQMDRLMPEFWSSYAAQARLAPPPEYEKDAREWMTAMAAVGSDFEALRSGAKRGDEALMKSANDRLAEDGGASARLSRRLGMKICFS